MGLLNNSDANAGNENGSPFPRRRRSDAATGDTAPTLPTAPPLSRPSRAGEGGSPFPTKGPVRRPSADEEISLQPVTASNPTTLTPATPVVNDSNDAGELKFKKRSGVPEASVPEYDRNIDTSGFSIEQKAEHYMKQVLLIAIENNASDVHFISEEKVYIRRKDELIPITEHVIGSASMKEMLLSNMPEKAQAEFHGRGETDYAIYPWGLKEQRFRVNAFTAQGMTGAVMRLITSNVPSLEDLGLPEKLKELSTSKDGLFLIAGATGSGKSTTLAAMLNHVNVNYEKRIFTIEDPVEILHRNKKSLITQREVGQDTDSFDVALRSAMRQNPDIILIGEIRDEPTAKAAIQAAQTGHFVLSTIHAGTSEETLERFANIFPAEDRENIKKTLGYTLRGIVAQRLIMDVDGGRTPLLEIMSSSHRIERAIYEAAEGVEGAESVSRVIEESNIEGMRTIDQALVELVMQGRVHPSVAAAQAVDRLKLVQNLKQAGLTAEELRK